MAGRIAHPIKPSRTSAFALNYIDTDESQRGSTQSLRQYRDRRGGCEGRQEERRLLSAALCAHDDHDDHHDLRLRRLEPLASDERFPRQIDAALRSEARVDGQTGRET